jgi:hypothetical protein
LKFQPNNLTPGVKKFDTLCQKSWLFNGQKIWPDTAKKFGKSVKKVGYSGAKFFDT